ncbi:MAG: hypothetical protein LBR16_06205 [Treponema sp.]|jgi:hypothetical protein|nr:hypothetical protein [Treponema sp.]
MRICPLIKVCLLFPSLLLRGGLGTAQGAGIAVKGETAAALTLDYNRAFGFCSAGEITGSVELNRAAVFRAGLLAGGESLDTEQGGIFRAGAFFDIEYRFFFSKAALAVRLSYKNNAIPQYMFSEYGLGSLVSIQAWIFEAALGLTNRWTFYGQGAPLRELVPSYLLSVRLFQNDRFRAGLAVANFDAFNAQNFGSYFYTLSCVWRFAGNFSLLNELSLHQAGSINMTANFYGIVYKGGLVWTY